MNAAEFCAKAVSYQGKVPYVLGAPECAMDWSAALAKADCSSYVQCLGRKAGFNWRRTADLQFQDTERFRVAAILSNLRPGDLLFFGGWDSPDNPPGYAGVQHVAISLGGDRLVEETTDNVNNVRIGSVSAYGSYWLYAARPFQEVVMGNYKPANGTCDVTGGAAYAGCHMAAPAVHSVPYPPTTHVPYRGTETRSDGANGCWVVLDGSQVWIGATHVSNIVLTPDSGDITHTVVLTVDGVPVSKATV